MWQFVAWLPVVFAAVVCGCCAVLLVRGVRYSFIVLFGVSALIQLLGRLAPALGPISRGAAHAMGVVSAGGILLAILGWISLTRFMLQPRSTSRDDGTFSV